MTLIEFILVCHGNLRKSGLQIITFAITFLKEIPLVPLKSSKCHKAFKISRQLKCNQL